MTDDCIADGHALVLFGHLKGHPTELPLQRIGPLPAGARAIGLTRSLGLGRRFPERCPSARRSTELLVALAEVQQSSDPRIHSLAALQLSARLLGLASLEQANAFVKERFGRSFIGRTLGKG